MHAYYDIYCRWTLCELKIQFFLMTWRNTPQGLLRQFTFATLGASLKGHAMRKVIAATMLSVLLATSALVVADAGQPLTNGTFDNDLAGWDADPQEAVAWDAETQSAMLLPYMEWEGEWPIDTETAMSQVFLLPQKADELSFDVTMYIELGEGGPETDVLAVTVDGTPIYSLTSEDVYNAALNGDPRITYSWIYDDIVVAASYHTTVTVDAAAYSGDNVELLFHLFNDNTEDDYITTVWIDNVAVSELKDVTPPTVNVGEMMELWPPNHKYRTFRLSDCVSVVDNIDGPIDVDQHGRIVSIYSDEPEDVVGNGDGNTLNDIVIANDVTFMVRAERQGKGDGRVYGVTFEVEDSSGNVQQATFYLGVPHDQSGDKPIDDGPSAGYVVYH